MIVKSKTSNLIYHYIKHLGNFDYLSISNGAFDPYILLFWLLRKKTIRLWIGTDVLKVNTVWHYRLRAKLCNLFVSENIAVARWLSYELSMSGIKAETLTGQYACICKLIKENQDE